jgi:hypothetical protein
MNKTSHLDRENRKLEHRLEKLQEQLKDLTDDNRDLHRQMTTVVDRLSVSATAAGDTGAPPLALPPPAPAEGLITRGFRKGLRMAAGAVRTLRRATDPGADMVRVLAAVTDPLPAKDLPIVGEDILLDLIGDTNPATIGALDLPWLFALEGIDAAWIQVPGHGAEVLAARQDLYQTLHDHGLAGLAQAATVLGRAVIAKRLPCPSPPEGKEWLLRPAHLDDGSTVWRNASYLVGLPKNVRRAELRLNTTDPPVLPVRPTDLFILISEPLVEGLEQRLATGLEAVGDLSRMIVSLAPWTEAGTRRLKALSSIDNPVHDFGSILHPATWDTADRSLLQSASPTTLWAIGPGNTLDPLIDRARQVMPNLRVVGEAVDADNGPKTADTTIVRTEAQRNRLEGTPGIGALHLAPTPLMRSSAQSTPEIRRTLGVPADATLVVVAGDLTASSRAEDAAAMARRLTQREDIWFRVVGRGPLGPAVNDLGRLFGLDRFSLSHTDHRLEDIVAAADVVCCLSRCEVLPPAAAIAVASGVPMVAPSSGETSDLAESGIKGIHLGGTAGDTEALTVAVLEAIAAGAPASGAPDTEITNRVEQTGRIYREALTGKP